MVIDQAKISVKAGNGGNGAVSFRREKYVAYGGPDGGNGGRGGSIYFVATHNISTLTDFRFGLKIKAESGGNGALKNQYGRSGEDLYVNVPVGTVVYSEPEHVVLADFKVLGETKLIAKGGKGGRGNTAFKSSINRVPRIAEAGVQGEELSLTLELKLLADVGFIGFPNAGKSTLLSVISDARPEIADYPFTTLHPQLGVVTTKSGKSFVASDLPGIIEGASQGRGLGLKFLRHAQRCRMLVILIDGETEAEYFDDYKLLTKEINAYGFGLEKRPQLVVVSKIETDEAKAKLKKFKTKLKKQKVIGISSLLHENIDEFLNEVTKTLKEAPEVSLVDASGTIEKFKEYDLTKFTPSAPFEITKDRHNVYVISGPDVEARYAKYVLSSEEAVLGLLQYLREIGVEDALEKAGIQDGDTVRLVDFEFEYYI